MPSDPSSLEPAPSGPVPSGPAAGLVPVARFGAALHVTRTRRSTTLTALARHSAGRFLPDDLVAIERGEVALSDDDVVGLAALYELPRAPLAPPSVLELVLDRSSGLASVVTPLATDDVAARLVAVSVLAGVDLTSGPFRLTAFAEAVELSMPAALAVVDGVLADPPAVGALVESLGRRIALADVGVLVAPTVVGDLVLVGPAGADRCDGGVTLAELATLARTPR